MSSPGIEPVRPFTCEVEAISMSYQDDVDLHSFEGSIVHLFSKLTLLTVSSCIAITINP